MILTEVKLGGDVRNQNLPYFLKCGQIAYNIESCPYLASGTANKPPTGHLLPAPPANYEIFETSSKYIPAYQSMRNFMLISKMYTFVYISCRFFELWPFKGRKGSLIHHTRGQIWTWFDSIDYLATFDEIRDMCYNFWLLTSPLIESLEQLIHCFYVG